jgi:CDP-diacylglycerol--glycerol-3-phosphate 3-phosphatidyltransferase
MGFEQLYAEILVGGAILVAIAYMIRVSFRGKAHFARIDRQGGSSLLSKEMMEGAYWFLQLLGVTAGACLAFGHFGSGAVFATISALLDALDGMVARATGVSSDAGEVLDAAVDRYAEFFFLSGLVIYYRELPILMFLALSALLGSFMVSYSTAKAEALQVEAPKGSMRRPERAFYLILGAALSPVTIPWFEGTSDLPIPIGHPMVLALCLVGVLANISAVERFWVIAKTIRFREREQTAAQNAALEPVEQTILEEEEPAKNLP